MKNTFDIKRFIALLLVICSLISMGLEVSATTLTQYEIAAAKKVEYISDYDFDLPPDPCASFRVS